MKITLPRMSRLYHDIDMAVAHAEANRFTIEDLKKDHFGGLPWHEVIGFTIKTEEGFVYVITIEEQFLLDGRVVYCRHLSVSCPETGKLPHPFFVKLVLSRFKFRKELFDCVVFFMLEKSIAHIIEPIDPEEDRDFKKNYILPDGAC